MIRNGFIDLRTRVMLGAAACASTALSALAQEVPANCELGTADDPARQILSCDDGLVIEAEAAARLGIIEGEARSFTLEGGAALVQVASGQGPQQIRTPHAIAAVRGTLYAVDATQTATSVFVQEGSVGVSPLERAGDGVVLGAGEGVDVTPGAALEANTWSAARVAELMARFGR
ncbi:FecR domain-containing protein [Sulfitobacter sp. LCG007]